MSRAAIEFAHPTGLLIAFRQVAMFFADLRGSTNFVDAVEPKELMRVLDEADAETRVQKGSLSVPLVRSLANSWVSR